MCQPSTILTILRLVKGLVHSDVTFGFTELNVKNSAQEESSGEGESAFQAAGMAGAMLEIHKTVSFERMS